MYSMKKIVLLYDKALFITLLKISFVNYSTLYSDTVRQEERGGGEKRERHRFKTLKITIHLGVVFIVKLYQALKF